MSPVNKLKLLCSLINLALQVPLISIVDAKLVMRLMKHADNYDMNCSLVLNYEKFIYIYIHEKNSFKLIMIIFFKYYQFLILFNYV